MVIAPDTTHIQTEQLQRRTTSLIYPPADLCVWTDGSVLTNFGPGGTGVLFYATSARFQHHFSSSFTAEIQSSIIPLDGAYNITPLLPIHDPGCLY